MAGETKGSAIKFAVNLYRNVSIKF